MGHLTREINAGNTEMSKLSKMFAVIKVALYIILFILRLFKVGLKYLWYKIVFYIRWRIALRKTRKILRRAGLSKEEAKSLAKEITGPPPSLRKMMKMTRRF